MASSKTQVDTTYATPKTWATGDALTATNMNDELRDEIIAVKTPAHAYGKVDEASNYSINTTTWTDVDATNLAMTVITSGGVVDVWFNTNLYYVSGTGTTFAYFDINVDGSRQGGDDGLVHLEITSTLTASSQIVRCYVSGLSAASHTFKLQWKRITGTSMIAGMYAGAGTTNHDIHPTMGLREIT